jgi:hypothetical protein
MVDYTEREERLRERERERKGKCFTSPAHHREKKFCVRKKKKIKFLFLLLKYATIKFLITHKFCSFCSSCGLRETSIGVDYTERRKTERKKFLYVSHHLRPTTEREKKFFFREIKN